MTVLYSLDHIAPVGALHQINIGTTFVVILGTVGGGRGGFLHGSNMQGKRQSSFH